MDSSLSEANLELIKLKQKLAEYEHAIIEKDYYLAKLEMDLEHAIGQCKKIAASKNHVSGRWIDRSKPGLERES